MKRRTYLGLLGSVGGIGALAGCNRQTTKTQPTPEPTPAQTEEPTITDVNDLASSGPVEFRGTRFEQVVNAVDDLGWDPNGTESIEDSLADSMAQSKSTLVTVPPGNYLLADRIIANPLENWGMVGLGPNRRHVQFTVPKGESFRVIQGKQVRNVVLQNFTLQQGMQFDRSLGMGFIVDDNLQIHSVEKAGANPSEKSESGAISALAINVVNPKGTAVVNRFIRTGPQDYRRYPGNAIPIFTGHSHVGTVYYRNVHIENGGENGIYGSHAQGNVRVEGGFFKNCLGDQVRISGEGSYVRGATIVIDRSTWDPRNRGDWHQARGIRMQSGRYGYTGGIIEDTEFILKSTPRTEALLKIEHSQGTVTVRNCQFVNDTSYPTIAVDKPHRKEQRPEKPWDVLFEGLELTGNAQDSVGIELRGRPKSVLRDIYIEQPERGVDGLVVQSSAGTILRDSSITTGGYPIRLEGGPPTGGQCSLLLKGGTELQSSTQASDDKQLSIISGLETCIEHPIETGPNESLALTRIADNRLFGQRVTDES